ncbi:MAG TPA: hypothetical protein VL049_25405, partial [Candidatus Dormibacteraeota bacterium]|nr:hypothetical protein [Candidatus Dormibacteraeota bacterium]
MSIKGDLVSVRRPRLITLPAPGPARRWRCPLETSLAVGASLARIEVEMDQIDVDAAVRARYTAGA